MEGFVRTAGAVADAYHVLSQFFTPGVPEITRFGLDASLPTHGASATSLHMMKGVRVAWFSIGLEQRANEGPRLESGRRQIYLSSPEAGASRSSATGRSS